MYLAKTVSSRVEQAIPGLRLAIQNDRALATEVRARSNQYLGG
jgi:hypothetical protein